MTDRRRRHDLTSVQPEWRPWIENACASVGVDPALVDVGAIHDLSGAVARGRERPMGPVSTYIWGLAVAQRPDEDPEALRRAIVALVDGRGR